MLKNKRIEVEGYHHRYEGGNREGCPYTGLDAVDWLRGYDQAKREQLRRQVEALPTPVASFVTQAKYSRLEASFVSSAKYSRLEAQAMQLAMAALDLDVATPKGLRLKALARNLLDGGHSTDEATWAAVAARLQPHLRK